MSVLANLMLDGRDPFAYPPPLAQSVRRVLGGAYEYPLLPDAPAVRRVLDIGAGVGDFACWVFKRHGRAVFVDSFEPLPQAAEVCAVNQPPGGRVHAAAVVASDDGADEVDLFVGADWDTATTRSELLSGRSAHHTVPAVRASDLPPCELLKLSAGGADAAILGAYPHLSGVQVLMVAWSVEQDRLLIEDRARRVGLRLFKSTLDSVSAGVEVWVRSRAEFAHGRYVMPLPTG